MIRRRDPPTACVGNRSLYLQTQPALLSIGAKEQAVFDNGSRKSKKNAAKVRPKKRYVPLVKKEGGGGLG